ncbi:hypothetical protein BSM4216_0648 [Bacillus smithii]|nr:hypothetical protein BSM4216_0648 [Bacillus smithii]
MMICLLLNPVRISVSEQTTAYILFTAFRHLLRKIAFLLICL